jgi:hypothetical protein
MPAVTTGWSRFHARGGECALLAVAGAWQTQPHIWLTACFPKCPRAFMRALFADQRRRDRQQYGVRRGHCGAVTFIGSSGFRVGLKNLSFALGPREKVNETDIGFE